MSIRRQKLRYLALIAALTVPCTAQTSAPKPTNSAAGKSAAAQSSSTVKTGIKRGSTRKKPAQKAPEPPPVEEQKPPEPPPPSRLYEMPPVAPQVTFSDGQLMVSASNCTLADILNAVRARTGTKIEYPASASQERVAIQLGPGKPRDVLAKLLLGSPFDYILVGSEQDPDAVTQVMLTRREGGPATTAVAGNRPNQAPAQPEPADDDAAENEPAQPVQPQPQEPGPPPTQARPQMFPQVPQAPEQNANSPQPLPGSTQPPPQENQVKTPEQLLRELQQRMQQEQQRRQSVPK